MTDAELIDAVKSGDKSAFTQIINRHQSQIACTVHGMLGECYETDDVGQEVFIRFYNSIDKFRGDSELSTYLVRIAINLSLNELKRRKRRTYFSLDTWKKDQKDKVGNSLFDNSFEQREQIQKAMNKLEANFRSVVTLRLIAGFSVKETAEILSVPIGTVLSRFARAQKKLKTMLAPLLEE